METSTIHVKGTSLEIVNGLTYILRQYYPKWRRDNNAHTTKNVFARIIEKFKYINHLWL